MNNTNADIEGYMVDKSKTKSAMLLELESIKGLLLEDDTIPILQEVIEHASDNLATQTSVENAEQSARRIYIEQQDFFRAATTEPEANVDSAEKLLDTLSDLEKMAAETNAIKSATNAPAHPLNRPSLAKATGENPFLPEHIRARLHGNNPPPLFEVQAAQKIARVSKPTTLLGSTQLNQHTRFSQRKSFASQQELIDDLMDSLLPDIEKELRHRLENMSKETLTRLLNQKG